MSTSRRRWLALIIFLLLAYPATASAQSSVTLAWDPSSGATGYVVKWGTAQGQYPNSADAGAKTSFVIGGLTAGTTYWTVVQAYNAETTSADSIPLQFTAPSPTVCTYSINPATVSIGASAADGTVFVTTAAGCEWSASSSSAFIGIQNGTGRSGSGGLSFTVAANTSTTSRTGTATIAGKVFTVIQAAATPTSCTYSINPISVNVGSSATEGSIFVTTQPGCGWSATSLTGFIGIQNGAGRVGSGSVPFTIAANTSTASRTGTAKVAGQVFTVVQAGVTAPSSCSYLINPSTIAPDASGVSGTILVTTQAGCPWSATSSSPFILFQNGTDRVGSGSVSYTVTENTTAFWRSGTGTVAGRVFTVIQASATTVSTCTYSINPTTVSIGSGATDGTIFVTTQAGCDWTATSSSGFVSLQAGSGTGSGSVPFTVTANTSASSRTGTATIGGKVFTVVQAGGSSQQTCTSSISPQSMNIAAAATEGTIDVATQTGCAWTATSSSAFVSVQAGSGSGAGSVPFTIAANTSTTSRTGTATIAGQVFTVIQAGAQPSNATEWEKKTDFNGDGYPDLLLQDTVSGNVVAWSLGPNGTTVLQSNPLSAKINDLNWNIVGTGDFNGDGKPDIVLHHRTEGWIYVWFMDGLTRIGGSYLSINRVADTGWQIMGIGDFNGDGKPDLIWQHLTLGNVAVWYMNGITVYTNIGLVPNKIIDLQWRIMGTGDFNGDGKTDIVWRHSGYGEFGLWLMDGAIRQSYVTLTPSTVTNQAWQLVGIIDANGDNKPDFVWTNVQDGSIAVWYISGLVRTGNPSIAAMVPSGWKVVGPK